ncbi:MAG: DUF3149 domain-containing protein [archaeon]
MIQRYSFVVIFAILLFSLAFADIGPSPSYTFSISNAADYPGYTFFYSGNIWQDKLSPITDNTGVYKFNTTINIYAIKSDLVSGLNGNQIDKNTFLNDLIESNVVKLGGGHTTFAISSFDEANKSFVVSVNNFAPDTAYPMKVLFSDPVGLIFLAVIICIVVLGVFFVFKRFRKSK